MKALSSHSESKGTSMTDIHRRIKNIEKILGTNSKGTHCPTCGHHDCWKRGEDMDCDVCGPVKFCIDLGGTEDCPHEHDFVCPTCGYESKVFLIDLGGEADLGYDNEH